MLEQRDSLIMETRKMMEEQQKRHEAAQQALQNQIEMLKVVINTQVPNNTSLQSPNMHQSPILSEKASTNIERKLEEGEKEICGEEGCEDVVEQTESEFMKYRARRKDTYTQMELDEVREELASHVLEWLFD